MSLAIYNATASRNKELEGQLVRAESNLRVTDQELLKVNRRMEGLSAAWDSLERSHKLKSKEVDHWRALAVAYKQALDTIQPLVDKLTVTTITPTHTPLADATPEPKLNVRVAPASEDAEQTPVIHYRGRPTAEKDADPSRSEVDS